MEGAVGGEIIFVVRRMPPLQLIKPSYTSTGKVYCMEDTAGKKNGKSQVWKNDKHFLIDTKGNIGKYFLWRKVR